jgi:hypothetical protein
LRNGRLDGELVVVARDLRTVSTRLQNRRHLHEALDRWEACGLYDALNAGDAPAAFDVDPRCAKVPLTGWAVVRSPTRRSDELRLPRVDRPCHAIEVVDTGKIQTPFMRFADEVRMKARTPAGASYFGASRQWVVRDR